MMRWLVEACLGTAVLAFLALTIGLLFAAMGGL